MLEALIEKATMSVKQDYEVALRSVGELKARMNESELKMSKNENVENNAESLSLVRKELDGQTDSMILKSKEAWKVYGRLKQDCETQRFEPPQLDELRMWCKKTEQLAADLLCYSLGAIRNKNS